MTEIVYMPYEYTEADGTKKIYEYQISKSTQNEIKKYPNVKIQHILSDEIGETITFAWSMDHDPVGGIFQVYQEYIEEDILDPSISQNEKDDYILNIFSYVTIVMLIAAIVYYFFNVS